MIKVSVFYPNSENAKFDLDYYCNKHMPMVRDLLGDTCMGLGVDHGLAGGTPGARPAYAAIGHLFFETVAAFQALRSDTDKPLPLPLGLKQVKTSAGTVLAHN